MTQSGHERAIFAVTHLRIAGSAARWSCRFNGRDLWRLTLNECRITHCPYSALLDPKIGTTGVVHKLLPVLNVLTPNHGNDPESATRFPRKESGEMAASVISSS